MRSHRVVRLLVGLLVVFLAAASASAHEPGKRRNINCYSPDDVKLYRHAVQVLKDRNGPKTKPPVPGSYDWYAALHNGNGSVSSCSHMNELFLPWHRALLWEFERALQDSDPAAGTRAIMLPYWNWSEPPSGNRYPEPFEVTGDVLYASRRKPQTPKETLYTSSDIEKALKPGTWVQFGGFSCNDNPDCPGGGGGSLEDPYHNKMHGWVGGAMTYDTQAAVDPLFWSFHAYIDAVFAQWQNDNPNAKLGCRGCPFRALPQWNPALVEHTTDLGYTYDFGPCAVPPAALAESVETPERATTLGTVAKSAAEGPAVFDLRIPAAGFRSAEIRITGAEVPAAFDYSGSVYLYPAKTKLAPDNADFRRKYFVDHFSIWGMQKHEHHPGETTLHVDATDVLTYLARVEPGATWKVAVVVDEITPHGEEPVTAEALTAMRELIRFESVSLVLDRGYDEGAQ